MKSEYVLVGGALVTIACAITALVFIPYTQVVGATAPDGLKPYTEAELRGRDIYIKNGCLYCHSQQPRPADYAPADAARGWGRPTVAGDYVYDNPVLLGTMRTGPDLMNIGVRQPSQDWNLGHLFQPRAYVAESNMPPFPYLFDVKDQVAEGEVEVKLPPEYQPEGKHVIASQDALDLVAYLKSLNRSYPIIKKPFEEGR